ncbi:MAG: GTP-binding protein, partial [Gammaproteobacteria bacterium]|nr:GTP-binding protein [Gammaproteobacteria bacterium]
KTLRIWDTSAGRLIIKKELPDGNILHSLAWSPDGKYLAGGGEDTNLYLWISPSLKDFHVFNGHKGYINSVAYSPDGRLLATGASDNTIRLWDTETGKSLRTLKGHSVSVYSVAFSPDGKFLASTGFDHAVRLWDVSTGKSIQILLGHTDYVPCTSWSPDRYSLGSAGAGDKSVRLWDVITGRLVNVLEGHTGSVISLSFSADGRILATKSNDRTVRLWNTANWSQIAKLDEFADRKNIWSNLLFHPSQPAVLATLGGQENRSIRIWDLELNDLLGAAEIETRMQYISAKIVLVGESNVGKSCLAMRLAKDRYPKDHEHGTTHGMRFWPMDVERLHVSAKPPPGQRREVVLWDLGGQDEYRLVHQLFLHDTTLVLVLIDPTRGRAAFDEARDWNKRLEKHLGKDKSVKLLVGAKQDKPNNELINRDAINELCRECGFADYIDTSARTNRNIKSLRKAIASALDWDRLAMTSRPGLFQRIYDDLEARRKRGEIVLLLKDLKNAIKKAHPQDYEEAAAKAVADQLATQGVIVQTCLTKGEEALVLQLPIIERYAGSLILAARNNPRKVPALEERLLGSREIPLPGIGKKDRLNRPQECVVLECIAELMIQHGICFRHEGLLIFPTLFQEIMNRDSDEKIQHSVSLSYDFMGPTDNIHAALVARLMISEEFGKGRLWRTRTEFDNPDEGICGIQRIKHEGGLAYMDLFFAEATVGDRRSLFTRFVEDHLRHQGGEVHEHKAIKCRGCQREIAADIVRANVAVGEKDVVCPWCRTQTLISEDVKEIREHDPESDTKFHTLQQKVEKRTVQD